MPRSNSETRSNPQPDLRASTDGGQRILEGYAAKFDVLSNEIRKGGRIFREIIRPGAFNLAGSTDVIFTFQHNDSDAFGLLGRTTSGTLEISVDDVGLSFRCKIPETVSGDTCLKLVERRDLKDCSFSFDVFDGVDKWSQADGYWLRELISGVVIHDVCVCIDPAYPDTEIAARSLERAIESASRPAQSLGSKRRRLDLAGRANR